jgi:Aspartyl protease
MQCIKSAILSLALAAALAPLPDSCHAADPPSQPSVLPLAVYDGYLLVVEGNIGSRHGLKFLLDTGSTHTTIDRTLARDINAPSHKVKILNGDHVISVDQIRLPELSLGSMHVGELDATVADLSYLVARGVSVDAIVGLDVLSRRNLFLDLTHNSVTFGAAPDLPHHAALRSDAFSAQVQVELDGHSGWMIADTGTPAVIFFEGRLAALGVPYRASGRIVGTSFGGAVDSRIASVPRLRIAGQALDRHVYLTATPSSTAVANTAGYFGIASLHARLIAFDFANHELRWAD